MIMYYSLLLFRCFFHLFLYLSAVFISCSEKLNFIRRDLLELIKRWSKVYQKNAQLGRALNFDQMETFFLKTITLQEFRYGLFTKLPSITNSKEVLYLHWQNKYSDLKTICHIELINFYSLLLVKYLMSVIVALLAVTSQTNCSFVMLSIVIFLGWLLEVLNYDLQYLKEDFRIYKHFIFLTL